MKSMGTQWFELSGRELKVLLAGACIVLLGLIGLRLARSIYWEPEVKVESARDLLRSPAPLDVNTAKEYELTLLPGIGPKTAHAIIEYRDTHGGFGSIEEVAKVSRIGQGGLERLRKQLICVPIKSDKAKGT